MSALVIAIRIFCLVPFATGLADLVFYARVFEALGLTFPGTVMGDPALNSQIGFWGAIWFGMGLLLWKCTNDLERQQDWFYLLCGILFLSGVGRAVATIKFGFPPTPLTAAMAIELIGMPLAVLWHRAVRHRLSRTSVAEHAG